ncbi:MAG TPA: hypothetical protein PLP01_12105, partial [Phycisphaerae bacterium]|nr:hypothetical protein [Phycisphaerae bacterium]
MDQSTPAAASFEELYQQLGVAGALHMSCPNARTCWRDQHRPVRADGSLDTGEPTYLPRPWVGPLYGDLRLVCLAINMNENGGRFACDELVTEARERIREGCTRVK